MAWVRWENVLASFEQGGLVLVKLIKAIHGSEAGFDGKGCATSGIWSSIETGLGNGEDVLTLDTETLFHNLQSELVDVTLSSSLDSWKWLLGNDISFSLASTRSHIDHLMLPSLASSTTWNSCLPRK
ncbi:hypothetical protein Tco_0124493, partial [Tanacetum coccineum]